MRRSYVVGKQLQSAGDPTYGCWPLLSLETHMVELRRRSPLFLASRLCQRGAAPVGGRCRGRDTKSKLVDQAEWRWNETCLRNRTAKEINVVILV